MSKKEYFPNNWQQYKDSPDSNFIPHTFEEVMSWKVGQWELPSSVCCIIRWQDATTKQVLGERSYSRHKSAQAKINQLINSPNIEFTVADHEAIHFLCPQTND